MMTNHIEDPNNKDARSDHDFDTPLKLHGKHHRDRLCGEPIDPHLDPNISQDLVILPFTEEDNIDDVDGIVLPKGKY